jgi:hypothetical protein
MEIRGPYSPRYCKAESAKACAEYIVKEYLTFIDQYNLYNRDTAFMQTYLETPALGSGHKIQSVRAKLIYQAGEVLMEYKRELARFLEAAQLWSDHTKVEAKERSVFRRIIPRGDDWYTTY